MKQTILITGSSRGIGKAIALRLAQAGFDIVVHCRNRAVEAEAVAQAVRELGQNARILQFDVSNRVEVAEKLIADVLHPIMMPMIRRRKAGRIVCITSVSGLIGNRGQVNYSASKAGIIGAAKALAVELANRKITVNCVAPGLINTDILDENVPIDEILKMIPAGRMGDPEEVAHAVNFLMDEKAAYITRQVIAVNGGLC